MTQDETAAPAEGAAPAGGAAPEGGTPIGIDRDAPPSERPGSPKGGRPKRRELSLADGHRLVLNPDRTIVHRDAAGGVVASWSPTDPDWARHALRFGLRPVEHTANPHDRHIRSSKPPGW